MGDVAESLDEGSRDDQERRQKLTEVGVGITLVGVIVNMGLSIGFGLSSSPLFVRLPLAFGLPLVLVIALAFLTRRIDLLATIPWWLTRHGPEPWEHLRRDRDQD
jgi:hypothetical protein